MTVPNKINGYEILSSIGSGTFGRTYRVKKSGQVYAMKVLKPEAIRDEADRKRFQRECRALQKITSDHVVSYHDHGIFDDEGVETYYVVMGCVEGADLHRRLRGKSVPRPERECRSVLSQVLAGLGDIHDQRIIHRDLKPANIFVTQDGTVNIVDFGLVNDDRLHDPDDDGCSGRHTAVHVAGGDTGRFGRCFSIWRKLKSTRKE